MPRYQGGCHCGRVRFEIDVEIGTIIDCNCSICAKKGFLHLIVDPSQVRMLSPADAVSLYQFNTRTTISVRCAVSAPTTFPAHTRTRLMSTCAAWRALSWTA